MSVRPSGFDTAHVISTSIGSRSNLAATVTQVFRTVPPILGRKNQIQLLSVVSGKL